MLLAVAAAPQEPAAPGRSLDEMDRAILSWIDEGFVPGAVLLHERIGEAPDARAFGRAGRFDGAPDMEARTVFDLASLTKVVATATSVMVLVDEGRVELDEPVATYLPGFGRNGKGSITVEELLLHRGGLIPDNALADYEDGSEEAWRRICDLPTRRSRAARSPTPTSASSHSVSSSSGSTGGPSTASPPRRSSSPSAWPTPASTRRRRCARAVRRPSGAAASG